MRRANEMGRIEFIALAASTMLLTALAIDIVLPAFSDLRLHFGLGRNSPAIARVVTFFFLGGHDFCQKLGEKLLLVR